MSTYRVFINNKDTNEYITGSSPQDAYTDLSASMPLIYKDYVCMKRHLAYAGADRDIFSDGAIDEIFRYSGGAAWFVNKACTHCLLYGSANY